MTTSNSVFHIDVLKPLNKNSPDVARDMKHLPAPALWSLWSRSWAFFLTLEGDREGRKKTRADKTRV